MNRESLQPAPIALSDCVETDGGVTILMPAHNAAPFIADALESALAQSVDRLQVIVVENGSTDDTAAIASRFGRRVQVVRSAERGAQAARNAGLRLATGKYLKLLDADDRLMHGILETQLTQAEQVEKETSLAFPYGDLQYVSPEGRVIGERRFRPLRPGENPFGHALEHAPLTSSPLHRTAFVRHVGGFDESLPREHETDLFFRLLLARAEPRHFPVVTYQYRQHEDGSNLMSGGVTRHGPMWPYEYLDRRLSDVHSIYGTPLPGEVRIAFAQKYWREGRAVLREGCPEAARKYFAKATALAGRKGVKGSWAYRLLNAFAGPQIAEQCGVRRR